MVVELIHPTKTAGTTISRFLDTVPRANVHGHETTLTKSRLAQSEARYILPFRHPIERAVSIYRYYSAGSEMWQSTRARTDPVSFDTFWAMVSRGQPPALPVPYMWKAHLRPQTWWVGEDVSLYHHPRVYVIPVGHDCPSLRDQVFSVLDT